MLAACAQASALPRPAKGTRLVNTGLDVLEAQGFAPLRGKRVGLITNQTGVDRRGRSVIDLLANAAGVKLVALFNPEHGLYGRADEKVESSSLDVKTKKGSLQLPVHSLFGDTRRPTPEMLQGIDALVFDIQDAGVRFYTYTTTMGYAMEEAAKLGIAFYVLDRPNLLGGQIVEGPLLDRDRLDFVGYFPMPVRYAMTIGELARMFNAENKIGCDLHIIPMKGWKREYFYADTGLKWIPPSPNLRTLNGELIDGAAVEITDGNAVRSTRMGLEIAAALEKLYPDKFSVEKILPLLGNAATIEKLKNHVSPADIISGWAVDLVAFQRVRSKYLLYH